MLHDDELRSFGFLRRASRVFSTTDSCDGDSIASAGVLKLSGLAAVPLSAVENSIQALPA